MQSENEPIAKAEADVVRQLPADLTSSEAVRSFVEDPLSTVVATVSAALAAGRSDLILAGGRMIQAIAAGRGRRQFARELDELLKKGKISPDFADAKHGFASFVELMKTIDIDATDEDKLRAAKAMFVALNAPGVSVNEAALRYQCLRIVLTLSGPQIAILGASYALLKKDGLGRGNTGQASAWLADIGNILGHHIVALVEQGEKVLIENGILTERTYSDRSGVVELQKGRLTDLGAKLAELIETYEGDLPKSVTGT